MKNPHSDPERVKLIEVMLPPNAPREYADPQTLWNAVDASESGKKAQTARSMYLALPRELTYEQNLALIREYCQKEFVDKGMCCNFFYHDKGDGNPHVHIMLTMRAMDENGKWLPKSKNVYVLDENGERIRRKSGSFVRQKIDTVDWNDQKYCEIWRHSWEVCQNNALEDAGRPERVDMRSLARQGIERMPQKHLGPAAAAMERKGIVTDVGNENRRRISVNKLLSSVQRSIKSLTGWIFKLKRTVADQRRIENPEDYSLAEIMLSYMRIRKEGRTSWSNYQRQRGDIRDIQEGFECIAILKELNISTVGDLIGKLDNTRSEVNGIKSKVKANNQTARDLQALIDSFETIKRTEGVKKKLDGLIIPPLKSSFAAKHSAELDEYKKAVWLRNKLVKKLKLTLPDTITPEYVEKVKKKIAKLEMASEQLRPQLERREAELKKLNKLRYWTRKVLPEASLDDPEKTYEQNEAEKANNRRELNRDMDAAVASVTRSAEAPKREEPSRKVPSHRKTYEPTH